LLCLFSVFLYLNFWIWDYINELFKNVKPDLGKDENEDGSNTPVFLDPQDEYKQYFRELSTNEELYDLDVIKSQDKGKAIDYSDVEKLNDKFLRSIEYFFFEHLLTKNAFITKQQTKWRRNS